MLKCQRIFFNRIFFNLHYKIINKIIILAKIISITVGGIILSTCSDDEESLLSVKSKFSNVILLDVKGMSCVMRNLPPNERKNDVPSLKTVFGGLELNWKGTNPIEIIYISIEFYLNNQTKTIVIEGDEMKYLFYGAGGDTMQSVILNSNQTLTSYNSNPPCPLEVGGLSVTNPKQNQSGSGSILVYGISEEDGRQIPYFATQDFTYEYTGIQ